MDARTSATLAVLAGLLLTPRASVASPGDAAILGEERDPGWRIEDAQLRTSYLDQIGHGWQSRDGATGEPGREDLWVFSPFALFTIRQSERVVHEVTIPVDVITAASPDAVDAISTASRSNEAFDLDVRTSIKRSDVDTLTTRVMFHYEEPLKGGLVGAGWRRSLADDNATVAVNANLGVDGFDHHDHLGAYLGKTAKETGNLNLSASQLLSPTTVIDASYGVTYQHGTLETGWNQVPYLMAGYTDEKVPRFRVRNALSVRLAQYVPWTRTALKAWYREYLDTWGLRGHTVELAAYQYLLSWLYVHGSYRFHEQNGVDFFTTGLPTTPMNELRTSDSDLAPLTSREWSIELATVRGRAPGGLRAWSVGAELLHYQRSNDLRIIAVSVLLGRLL